MARYFYCLTAQLQAVKTITLDKEALF